jgi:thioredoxin 1
MRELNDKTITEHLGHQVAIVDFWADWCGPCKKTKPVLEQIEADLPDVAFGAVDVSDHPELAASFEIMSIPAVLVFSNGKEVARIVGAHPAEKYVAAITSVG